MEGDLLRSLTKGWADAEPELVRRVLERGLTYTDGDPEPRVRERRGRAASALYRRGTYTRSELDLLHEADRRAAEQPRRAGTTARAGATETPQS